MDPVQDNPPCEFWSSRHLECPGDPGLPFSPGWPGHGCSQSHWGTALARATRWKLTSGIMKYPYNHANTWN